MFGQKLKHKYKACNFLNISDAQQQPKKVFKSDKFRNA